MILLTAFKPFGPKGLLTSANASEVVLRRIEAERPGRYKTATLLPGYPGLDAYRAFLKEGRWTGLLAMGETGGVTSEHVVLERFAIVVNNPGLMPPLPWTGAEPSLFAAEATAAKKGGLRSAGAFWCNRIYLEALRWARDHGDRPAAFVHVPAVLGASLPLYGRRVDALYDRYAEEVLDLLTQMEAKSR